MKRFFTLWPLSDYKAATPILLSLVCTPNLAMADEVLPTITVKEQSTLYQSASGTQQINQEALDTMPKGNGSLTDALETVPEIEIDDASKTSEQAGEIKPGKVSIHGSKSYENNFTVDGSPNNNQIDPGSDEESIGRLSGDSQELFLNLDLIESLEVFTSNIPAKYSQFSGGVVDAKTKSAQFKTEAKLSGRTTSDQWTELHVTNPLDFSLSENAAKAQPKFEKTQLNAFFNQAISDQSAFYINIDQTTSTIPILHLGETENERRQLQTVLAKISSELSASQWLDVSYTNSLYESTHYLPYIADSRYTRTGGGQKLVATLDSELSRGKMTTTFSVNQSENSRQSAQDYYYWAQTDTKPWGRIYDSVYSREGGLGDLNTEQTRLYLASDYTGHTIQTPSFKHTLQGGFELSRVSAFKERPQDANVYKVNVIDGQPESGLNNLVCQGADACIEGEQYAVNKTVYLADKQQASINQFGFYAEDQVQYARLYSRLGLRYDYNDFMQNHDVAYRIFNKLDLTGNERHFMTFGLNRYYGQTFLAYKLRQAGMNYQEYTRGLEGGYNELGQKIVTPTEWVLGDDNNRDITQYSSLNTPYSDEQSIGFESALFGGTFSTELVKRDYKEQFTKVTSPVQDDGHTYTQMTNLGETEYQGIKLAWQRHWQNHQLSISFFKGESESNFLDNYDEEADGTDSTTIVYDGQEKEINQLDIKDPTPATIKLHYSYFQPTGLNLGLLASITDAYEKFESTGLEELRADRESETDLIDSLSVYDYVAYDAFWRLDANIQYKYKLGQNLLTVSADVYNLFDQIQKSDNNEYALGRQFWLGLSYQFNP